MSSRINFFLAIFVAALSYQAMAQDPGASAPELYLEPKDGSMGVVFGRSTPVAGLTVSGHEYQMREQASGVAWTAITWSSAWIPAVYNSTLQIATIGSLNNGTAYEFRVRATTEDVDMNAGAAGTPATASATPGVVTLTAGKINLTASGSEIETCDATFSDGPGQYSVQRALTLILAPNIPGTRISVTFTSFQLEDNEDFLSYYDGAGFADFVASYTGSEGMDETVVSTSDDGKLTFDFISDETGPQDGWEAMVSCVGPTPPFLDLAPRDSQIYVIWSSGNPETGVDDRIYEYQVREEGGGADWGTTWKSDWTVEDYDSFRKGGIVDALTNGTTYELRVRSTTMAEDGTLFPSAITTASGAPGVVMLSGAGRVDMIADGFEVETCSGIFSDGPDPYPIRRRMTLTLAPDTPGTGVRVVFSDFDVEPRSTISGRLFDYLAIYHGDEVVNVDDKFVGAFTGSVPPTPVTSESPDGKLTFFFRSDSSIVGQGWEATISCVQIVPDPPTSLTASPISETATIDLSWSPPTNIGESPVTGYKIEQSANGLDTWTDVAADTGSTTTAYSHATGLAFGATIHYRVSATNDQGTGQPSSVLEATVWMPTVPNPPTGLSATSTMGSTTIVLGWSAPVYTGGTTITGYKIEQSLNSGTTWTDVETTTTTTTAYTHTGLTGGETIHYRVSAINGQGTGLPSSVVQATVSMAPTAPEAPTNLMASPSNGSTTIDLSWDEPANTGGTTITGYKIEQSLNSGTTWTDVETTTGIATAYSHADLTSGETIHYRVSAINAVDTGLPSNVASATVWVAGADAPRLFLQLQNGSISLVFGNSTPETGLTVSGYEYQMREADGADWTETWISSWSPTQFNAFLGYFTFGSLTNDTIYEFRVRAATTVDATGNVGAPGEPATASGTPGVVTLSAGRIDMTASDFEIETCDATFSDGSGQYSSNRLMYLTLAPATPGTRISVAFTSFQMQEDGSDNLAYYHGVDATTNRAGTFTGNGLLNRSLTSTSDDGKLTFQFTSDGEGTDEGWEATVYCVGAHPPYITLTPQDSEIYATWLDRDPIADHTIQGYEYQWRTAGGAPWGTTWRTDWTPEDVDTDRKGFLFSSLTNDTTYELRVRATTLAADGTTVIPGALDTASGAPGVVTLSNGRIDMTASGFEVTTCSGTFSDGLGPYPLRREMTLTLAPAIADAKISVTFTSFDTEQRWDFLDVYGGDQAVGTVVATFTGNILPPSVTSESPDGKLTFQFNSDFSNVAEGWEATVSCVSVAAPGRVTLEPLNGMIGMTWFPPSPVQGVTIDGYEYQMREEGAGGDWPANWESGWIPDVSSTNNLHEFVFTGLTNDIVYEFRIRAATSGGGVSSGGIGAASAAPGIVTLSDGKVEMTTSGSEVVTCNGTFSDGPGPYEIRRFLSLTLAPDTPGFKVRVTFTSFDTEPGFDILRVFSGAGNTATLLEEFSGSDLPAPVTSESQDGKLTFSFFSDFALVGEGWEAEISCVSDALPEAPTALTATPSSVSREVVLSWTPPGFVGESPVTGYQIESSPDGTTDSWSVLVADTGDTNTYTHTNLNNGQIIHYRVSAINDQGVGMASNVAQATVATLPATTPGAPTNLTATSSGSTTTIVLNWTTPTDTGGVTVTGYKIEHSADGATAWMEVVADTGDVNTYSHTGLTDDETIHYRVFAINSEGQGATASNVAMATVGMEPFTAPGAPTDLTATASGSTTTIVLRWTAPADTGGATITGYKIESSADGATAWMEVVADTGDVNTYSHTGLTDGETIHYRVFAINSEGQGAMASNVAMATVGMEPFTVPGAPTNLTATSSGSTTTIVLRWTAPADTGGTTISGYRIESSEDGSTAWMEVVSNTGLSATTYSHTGLTDDETIHYRVFAINSEGQGATASNVAVATVGEDPPFSSSPHPLSTVKVYPNPAVDVLYLDLEEGPDYIMTLLSLTGQLVVEEVQKGGGSLRMALPDIREGVYILRVEDSEGGVQSFKIVR